jgi:hypothetical protein
MEAKKWLKELDLGLSGDCFLGPHRGDSAARQLVDYLARFATDRIKYESRYKNAP